MPTWAIITIGNAWSRCQTQKRLCGQQYLWGSKTRSWNRRRAQKLERQQGCAKRKSKCETNCQTSAQKEVSGHRKIKRTWKLEETQAKEQFCGRFRHPAPSTLTFSMYSSPLPPSLPSPPALHRFTGGCHFPQCGQRLVREGPAATTGAAVVTGLITLNAPISACEKGQQSKQALPWLRELRFP